MGCICNLRVRQWAAIRVAGSDGRQEVFGQASGEDAIPSGIRRRMGRLERLAVRCTLGVLGNEATAELIFCSRYGNIETLGSLLRSITEAQPMSPMAFSGSVHNAAPGLVGQIRKECLSHTALAAGTHTFAAGLVESYARLVTDDCRDVTLTFADVLLPELYREFEEENSQPGLAMALRLELAGEDRDSTAAVVLPGRQGALEVLEKLRDGTKQVTLEEPPWVTPGS